MLRCIEILSLRWGDVGLLAGHIHLHLGLSKSGKRTGVPEEVVFNQQWLYDCLWLHESVVDPHTLAFPGSGPAFRSLFKDCVEELAFYRDRFMPYGWRRGGATAHFMMFREIFRTMFIGRWSQQRTARIYIMTAEEALRTLLVTPAQERNIAGHIGRFANLLPRMG